MTILDATFVFTGGRAFYYSTNEGATFDWLFPQAVRLSFEGAPLVKLVEAAEPVITKRGPYK